MDGNSRFGSESGGGGGDWQGIWPASPPVANVNFFRRPLSWLAIAAVKIYQKTLSRLWPNICMYTPSCSHYAIHAIRNRGLARGIVLGAWRIARCHPFARGGYDPPPGYEEECGSK